MITPPPVAVSGIDGNPGQIRGLASGITSRNGDLEGRGAHVSAAVAVLEGNHGKHVAQLRTRLAPLPQRYDALGKAYKDVGDILDDYATSVAGLQWDAQNLQSQVDDDTYRFNTARESCLASDPTFPGQNLPWDYAPSPYTAPNMTYLGQWHNALGDLTCSRDSLAGIASRRQELDEQTAAKLRAVTVDGPGVKDWLHKLAPAGALTVAGTKFTLKSLKVKNLLSLRKTLAVASGLKYQASAATSAITHTESALKELATGRGLPGEWVLNKTGLIKSAAVVRTLAPVARVLGPIGAVAAIGSGLKHFVSPSYTGARRQVDRAVGAVGVAGGATSLLIMAGAVSATGVGAFVVLGAAVVVGAWMLGNAIYDHWDDITGFASKAWKGVGHVMDTVNASVDHAELAAAHAVTHPSETLKKAGSFVKGLFS